MHQWQKFGKNPSTDTGDIVETSKSGMYSFHAVTLTFDLLTPKSVNRYWRYRGNIKLPCESRTDAQTAARTDDPKTYSLRRCLPADNWEARRKEFWSIIKTQLQLASPSQKHAQWFSSTFIHQVGYLCVMHVIWDWVSAWSNDPGVTGPHTVCEECGDSFRSFINRSGPDMQPVKKKPVGKHLNHLNSYTTWQYESHSRI